jgi:hypothetical protein
METDGMAGEETSGAVTAYKGFDKNLVCNPDGKPFQYEIGKTYEHKGNVVRCAEGGFHACEHPLNVFSYYPPATSRYCEVQMSGQIARDGSDTKIASARITIGVEVHLHELIQRAVKWVFDRSKPEGPSATGRYGAASATGYQGAASATGDQGAASATGYQGAASATGRYGAASATGYQGAASATGDQGAASATGRYGAASATGGYGAASATGDHGAASATGRYGAASATGYQGAASATGDRGAASATGDHGAASATGYQGAASATGYQGAASATGRYGAASATGYQGKARASEGSALFLTRRKDWTGNDDSYEITHVWAGIAGRGRIKPDTWYTLDEGGQPVEVA